MPVKFIDTKKTFTLGGGKSKSLKWNNTAPSKAVWSANAVPLPKFPKSSHTAAVQVTKFWRKIVVTASSKGKPKVEHELHCTVKNLGKSQVKFALYFLGAW